MILEITTTWTHIIDPIKVVMVIKVMTIDTTHEPEDGERRLRELRNLLPWSDVERKGPSTSQSPVPCTGLVCNDLKLVIIHK